MAQITVLPFANPAGSWQKSAPAVVGAPSVWEALAAVSETEHIDLAGLSGNVLEFVEFDLSAIPAGAIITSVSVSYRAERIGAFGGPRVRTAAIAADGSAFVAGVDEALAWPDWNDPTTYVQPPRFELGNGDNWAEHGRIGCLIDYQWGRPDDIEMRIYWASATITYDSAGPAAVVTAPVGDLALAGPVEWIYSQADGRPQTHYQTAVAPAGSADPETVSKLWDTGKTAGQSVRSVEIPAALQVGGYRALVRVWSTATSGVVTVSAWAEQEFSIDAPDPDGPGTVAVVPDAVVAAYDDDQGSVAVEVWGDGYDPAHAEALKILTDPTSTYWLDAADLKRGDSAWIPRNPGPLADPANLAKYLRCEGSQYARMIWPQGVDTEAFTISSGLVIEWEVDTPLLGDGSPQVMQLSADPVSDGRIGAYLYDDGRVLALFQNGTGAKWVFSPTNWDTVTGPGVRSTFRATLLGISNVRFEMSIDGGETWTDLGTATIGSPLGPIPTTFDMNYVSLGSQTSGENISIYALRVNGVDWFDAAKHAEPGTSSIMGSDAIGWWDLRPPGYCGDVKGSATGLAMLTEAQILEHHGHHYAFTGGQNSGSYTAYNTGTEQDWSSHTETFIYIVAENYVRDLDNAGYHSLFHKQPSSASTGKGRLLLYLVPAYARVNFYPKNHDGTTTGCGVQAGAMEAPAPYDLEGVTGLRCHIVWDVGTGAAGVATCYTMDPIEDVAADPAGANWSTEQALVLTGSTDVTVPGAGRLNINSSGYYDGACDAHRILVTDQNGTEYEDFYPNRDIDLADGPSAGQEIIQGPRSTWLVPTRKQGLGDTDQQRWTPSIVTYPKVSLPFDGNRGVALPSALSEWVADGVTIIIGRLNLLAETDSWDRVISFESATNVGPHLTTWPDLSGVVGLLAGGAPIRNMVIPALDVSSLAMRIGGGQMSLVGHDSGPGYEFADYTTSGVPGPARIGAMGFSGDYSMPMEFSSFVMVNRLLSDAETAGVVAALNAMSIAPIEADSILVERSSAGSGFAEVDEIPGPFEGPVARVTDLEAPLHDLTVYRARAESDTSAPSAWVQSAAFETTSAHWWAIDPLDGSLSFRPEVADWSIDQIVKSTVARQRGRVAAAVSPVLGADISVTFRLRDRAAREALEAMLATGRPFRLVNILGQEWTVKATSTQALKMVRAMRTIDETTGLRDFHMATIQFTQVGDI